MPPVITLLRGVGGGVDVTLMLWVAWKGAHASHLSLPFCSESGGLGRGWGN